MLICTVLIAIIKSYDHLGIDLSIEITMTNETAKKIS